MAGKRALIIDAKDTVATALEDIAPGDKVDAMLGRKATTLEAKEKIPFGFKIALTDTAKGDAVVKYGEVIGKASQPIKRGQLVHVHNLEGARGRGDLTGEVKKK
jgi:altronate dehydratase small subunit